MGWNGIRLEWNDAEDVGLMDGLEWYNGGIEWWIFLIVGLLIKGLG